MLDLKLLLLTIKILFVPESTEGFFGRALRRDDAGEPREDGTAGACRRQFFLLFARIML